MPQLLLSIVYGDVVAKSDFDNIADCIVAKNLNKPDVINQVCDCVIPDYDDAAGTWCRKCNAKIL